MPKKNQEPKNKTVGLNMKIEIADELDRRASSMGISTSAYCKIIFSKWLESGQKLKLTEK